MKKTDIIRRKRNSGIYPMESQLKKFDQRSSYMRSYGQEISRCSKPITVNSQRHYKKRYCFCRCSDIKYLYNSDSYIIFCLPEEAVNRFIECHDKLDVNKIDPSLGTVLHCFHFERESKRVVCIKTLIGSSSRPLLERKPRFLEMDKTAKGVESILNYVENDITISLKSEGGYTNSKLFNVPLVTQTTLHDTGHTCLFSSFCIMPLDNVLDDCSAKSRKKCLDFDQNNNVVNYPKVKKRETDGIIFPPLKAELCQLEHKDELHKVRTDLKEIVQQTENYECRGDCHNLGSHVTPEVTSSALDFETDGPVSVSSSPRHPEYRDKNDRLISFTTWRHQRVQDPHRLTNYGFFYTGQGDLVRCFYCGLGLKDFIASDDALLEHVRYSNWCPYLLELLGQKVLDDFKAKVKEESVRQEQQPRTSDLGMSKSVLATSLSRSTPRCRHPEYQTIGVRLASFSGWPRELSQTPQKLAEAGFYYTGTNDIVRCFFCDGGLQRWDPTDDPWIEHCRWFHTCGFVREMKGDSYVEQVKHYYQSRPNQQQVRVQIPKQPTNTQSEEDLQRPMAMMSLAKETTPAPLGTVSQVENTEKTNAKPIWRTSAAELVLEMGFKEHEVRQAVQQLQAAKRDDSPEVIIEVIEKLKKSTETKVTVTSRKAQELLAENSRLKSMLICNGCNNGEINMLFLPCQHHKFCASCSESMTHCPVCGKAILHKVKTYLS